MTQHTHEDELLKVIMAAQRVLARAAPADVALWRLEAQEYLSNPDHWQTPRDVQMMLYGTTIIARMLDKTGQSSAYEAITGPIAGLLVETWQLVLTKAHEEQEQQEWIPTEL